MRVLCALWQTERLLQSLTALGKYHAYTKDNIGFSLYLSSDRMSKADDNKIIFPKNKAPTHIGRFIMNGDEIKVKIKAGEKDYGHH